MKNKLLQIGIGIFVVILSLIASHTPINWMYFVVSALVMAVFILLQKQELKKMFSGNGENTVSLSIFEEQLNKSIIKIKELSELEIGAKYPHQLNSIIDNTFPKIDDFRISMINQFGVANYTKIIIPFAKGERLINRGVSSAVDGYFEESKKNISKSINFLKLAIDEINITVQNG